MVLTDMGFERGPLIHSRYSMLRRAESAPAPRDDEAKLAAAKDYAAFLKEQERKVGPDGFLDSNRYSHTYQVKKKDRDLKTARSEGGKPSVVKLSAKIEMDKKEHDRRIKIIEAHFQDHMWQHKQEERELKRTEGDIIKNQRSVRQTLRDFENAITKKRMTEEKKLNVGLQKYTVLRRDYVHQKHDLTKSRILANIMFEHGYKDSDRKSAMKKSDLARSYRAKLSEMELKQTEVMRISQDFENKMRQKEEEQYKLKQELAELAIALNMESQKARQQTFDTTKERKKETTNRIHEDLTAKQTVDNKLASSDGDTKAAEMNKRKLSADLKVTRHHISIKQRDEQRHLEDTRMRLSDNGNVQRELNEDAFHTGQDLKSKRMQQNIEAHNIRRVTQLKSFMKNKKEDLDKKQQVWEARFQKRSAEQARREHEDFLKFFQKMVTKGEDQEQTLYAKVRNSEYARQQQEQNVRRVQLQLQELKRKNAANVTQELASVNLKEQELEQQLIREKAELDKVHAEREESYIRLQKHRQGLRDDKHNLEEHEREHLRLQRIATRSDSNLEYP